MALVLFSGAAIRWLRTPWGGRSLGSSFHTEVYSKESRLFFPEIECLEAFPEFVQNKAKNSVMRGTENAHCSGKPLSFPSMVRRGHFRSEV